MEYAAAQRGTVIPPFWNRIPAFFLYGLKPVPLLLAAISGVLIYLTSSVWVSLILYAVAVKYSMEALQHTMRGELSPPPLNGKVVIQGYELPLALFLILLVYTFALVSIASSVSPILALLLFLLGVLLFPALIMCLGISESFAFSINPIHWLALVKSIGWPYLALYGFYLSLSGAQTVLEQITLDKVAIEIQGPVWMGINTIFMVISFHMMGYVILQYHRELQTSPPAGVNENDVHTTPLLQKFIQEGNSAAAIEELICLIQDHPDDLDLRKKLHNYAMLNQYHTVIAKYAPAYMQLLARTGNYAGAAQLFSDCLASNTPCHPSQPAAYLPIFNILKQRRNFNDAVALTKGFHKRFPDNDHTLALYLELAKLFSEELQRDDLAKKLLLYLLDHFRDHEKIPEVQRYLKLIESLSMPSR